MAIAIAQVAAAAATMSIQLGRKIHGSGRSRFAHVRAWRGNIKRRTSWIAPTDHGKAPSARPMLRGASDPAAIHTTRPIARMANPGIAPSVAPIVSNRLSLVKSGGLESRLRAISC